MATYRFTQPIRYYKANDPYYYEVDNIPLKQLEENILNVRESVQTLQGALGDIEEDVLDFSLTKIKDLKASMDR